MRLGASLLYALRRLAESEVPQPDSAALRRRQLEREIAQRAVAHAARRLSTEAYLAEHARLSAEIDALTTGVHSAQIEPDEAIARLRDLRETWRKADDRARAELVAALYDRIVVKGREFVGVELTPAAQKWGAALAMPESVVLGARPAGFEPAT